jgi:CheY-like chemotaxis protein
VQVADTGLGIPAEDRARIFDSFQQGSRRASAQEGTGLGLTLCKQILELHGGRIWVESEVGRGSTFAFRLPAAPTSEQRTDDASAIDGRLVLLVEDDPSSVDLLRAYLAGSGFRVAVARDGVTGLATVRRDRPAAVVLDIQLPGMDGWDVLAEIRRDPETRATPVLVVSVVDERARGHALGASAYLVKPVRRHDVLTELARLVPVTAGSEAGA